MFFYYLFSGYRNLSEKFPQENPSTDKDAFVEYVEKYILILFEVEEAYC